MAIASIKTLLEKHNLATPRQFEDWNKAWRVVVEGGSQETLLAFIAREKGCTEELFLQELAKALGWPFIDLAKTEVSAEARKRISTKVAFQYSVLPIKFEKGQLQVAVSNPFDAAMLSAVQFDARVPVQFRPGHPDGNREVAQEVLRRRRRNAGRNRQGGRAAGFAGGGQGNHRRATRRPASSSSSIRLSGRPSRTAPRTFISSRPRTSCASATALTAFCTRRRCRRN